MALLTKDIVFVRGGVPAAVTGRDPQTGRVFLDFDREKIQELGTNGLKNGLPEESREAFVTVLSDVKNRDKRREIDELYTRITELKQSGADSRLLRYLEGELHFRMAREKYVPSQVGVDEYMIGL
jgi:hypothetical protein